MFDIKRTSREALDHARRSLYKPDSVGCGQSPDQEMEVGENTNCDMMQEQVKKCQVSELDLLRNLTLIGRFAMQMSRIMKPVFCVFNQVQHKQKMVKSLKFRI